MIDVDSIEQYDSKKIIDFSTASELIQKIKSSGKTIGLCHGGFDLLHPGHVKHFESARKLCDVLFVSVTADKFVTSRKGSGRPVYTDQLRAYIIANVGFVDYVVISDFKRGVEVIEALKPSFYVKGPDFIDKMTPGIIAEREAIGGVGGEMKYTTESPMSTTKIIGYIKEKVDSKEMLVVIDRDGTIIENDDFFGKNDNWKEELRFNEDVISFLTYLQAKYKTTKVVVTNQTGVARKLFSCNRVEEINNCVGSELARRGIKIDCWQYCPDADAVYAELKRKEIDFDFNYVKEETKRKPSMGMVLDALNELGRRLGEFGEVIVVGNSSDDQGLAENLKAKYIDVTERNYEELVNEIC